MNKLLLSFSNQVLITTLLSNTCWAYPTVGARYQIDSNRYPEKIVVCTSESTVIDLITLDGSSDSQEIGKILKPSSTLKEIEKLKETGGCTKISSHSQAIILEKRTAYHKANFLAFPFTPMWGLSTYFGYEVK